MTIVVYEELNDRPGEWRQLKAVVFPLPRKDVTKALATDVLRAHLIEPEKVNVALICDDDEWLGLVDPYFLCDQVCPRTFFRGVDNGEHKLVLDQTVYFSSRLYDTYTHPLMRALVQHWAKGFEWEGDACLEFLRGEVKRRHIVWEAKAEEERVLAKRKADQVSGRYRGIAV